MPTSGVPCHADHEYLSARSSQGLRRPSDRRRPLQQCERYIRELIRDDEKRKAEERLEALLLEGLESEESVLTRGDFDAIRKEAVAQLKRRKKKA